MNATNTISGIIRNKGHPITFKEFMDYALYHPEVGYYSKKEVFEDDYITSSRFDIFANGVSVAFSDMLEKCSGDTIIEFGAGDGRLAEKVLKKLRGRDINYMIVERSEKMRNRAKSRLKNFKEVSFVDEEDLLDSRFNGIVFTNEFFDALPVNVVVRKDNGLEEVYVDWKDGKFVEVLKEPSTPEIENYFERLDVELEPGSRAEVNLDAARYIQFFGDLIEKGFVFTIDYGFPSEELYTPERMDGTIVCYFNNTYDFDPFLKVGEQDITSHVNFSALIEYGAMTGLDLTGLTNHLYFLMSTLNEYAVEDFESAEDFKFIAFRMGTYKVLVQHKGIKRPRLRCLQMTPSFGYWNRYNYQGQLEMEFLEE